MAHYPGTDSKKKPLLVIGHMDVVEAKREDWERDPFTPVVENGYVFGRGAVDNKFELSMITATVAKSEALRMEAEARCDAGVFG